MLNKQYLYDWVYDNDFASLVSYGLVVGYTKDSVTGVYFKGGSVCYLEVKLTKYFFSKSSISFGSMIKINDHLHGENYSSGSYNEVYMSILQGDYSD